MQDLRKAAGVLLSVIVITFPGLGVRTQRTGSSIHPNILRDRWCDWIAGPADSVAVDCRSCSAQRPNRMENPGRDESSCRTNIVGCGFPG